MKKPYIIAEIGVNFYDTAREKSITLLDAAKEYILAAKTVGIDCVKFQSYKADTLAARNSPAYWDVSEEPTKTQYELFAKFDHFNQEDYEELARYSKSIGIDFMSTPFDYQSVDYLADMVDVFKISSSDLNNYPFIRYIAKKGKPIYLSTGASYLSEVVEAVRVIQDAGCKDICVMHCVLSYPCKNQDANLGVIKTLKAVFPDLTIGYSDHTLPDENMIILSTAYLYGAQVIEKHFTLDKSLKGNDHYHAGDPEDFKRAIQNFEMIQQINGSGEKTVFPCEEVSRREARRSLVLTRPMKNGEIITPADIIAKRPGSGISPIYADIVVGRTLKYDLEEDTILQWTMV